MDGDGKVVIVVLRGRIEAVLQKAGRLGRRSVVRRSVLDRTREGAWEIGIRCGQGERDREKERQDIDRGGTVFQELRASNVSIMRIERKRGREGKTWRYVLHGW